MKPIANYDSAKEEAKKMGNVIPKIPVGGYVLKIESVRYEKGTDGKSDKIVLAYDVAEGEEKGFFKKQFDAITDENKKWKGVATIYVPDEDGNNNDWSVKKFAQTMNYFEESNAGFVWDWDEKKLKGKLIGGIFGEVQKPIDGKDVTWVAFRWFAPVDEIRKNAYKIPDKKVYGSVATETAAQTDGDFMDLGKNVNEDLPF
jgi:hypothetical protein